jgi:hypothetical protein
MRQSNEQTPPVVDQCHGTSSQLTAMQVVRGVAAPTPLVLEFIEGVLGIRPIPVELTEAENLVAGVGDENGVLVAGDLLCPFSVGVDEDSISCPLSSCATFSLVSGRRRTTTHSFPFQPWSAHCPAFPSQPWPASVQSLSSQRQLMCRLAVLNSLGLNSPTGFFYEEHARRYP